MGSRSNEIDRPKRSKGFEYKKQKKSQGFTYRKKERYTNEEENYDRNPRNNGRRENYVRDDQNTLPRINSSYVNLDPNLDLNATSLEELDSMENNLVLNNDNIYVDPFQPLFLAGSGNGRSSQKGGVSDGGNPVLKLFTSIADSYLDIINDLSTGQYSGISDLLLKGSRGIAVALIFILISVFFVFFNQIEY